MEKYKKVLNKLTKDYVKAEETRNFLYLSPHFLFSYNGFSDFVLTGVRGNGKTVIATELIIMLKRKYGYENVKAYWFRITDISIKALLADKAKKAVDPLLVFKYNLDITCKNNTVYDHGKPLFEAMPLVSAGSKGKGVNLFDYSFLANRPLGKNGKPIKRFIVTVWDEFLMAEGIEKRSVGDPVAQYKIYREAILRDAEFMNSYNAVYNLYLANSVSECAPVTGALFNYIPDPNNFRRVKLTRKHALFWNIPVTQAYIDKRMRSYNANIMDLKNDPNYTNEVKRDLALIKPKRVKMNRLTNIIKFTKSPTDWFCLYDGIYIRKHKGEKTKKNKIISMRRYIDELYDPTLAKSVIERFDVRGLMYADIMSQALFQAQLKLIKNK